MQFAQLCLLTDVAYNKQEISVRRSSSGSNFCCSGITRKSGFTESPGAAASAAALTCYSGNADSG